MNTETSKPIVVSLGPQIGFIIILLCTIFCIFGWQMNRTLVIVQNQIETIAGQQEILKEIKANQIELMNKLTNKPTPTPISKPPVF